MTLKIYNELHSRVRENPDFVAKWIDFFSENYPKGVKDSIKGGVCLDAGCGGTVKGSRIIRRFEPGEITVCDINPDHGRFYKQETGVDFVCCDLAKTPFGDEEFDFILCNGVAHHTPKPVVTLKELMRVLKKDGVMHISIYCFKYSLFHLFVLLLRAFSMIVPFRAANAMFGRSFIGSILLDHAYVPYEHVYTRKGFERMLREAGLDVTDVLDISATYSGGEWFTRLIVGLRKYLFGDGAILSFVGRKK